MFGLGNSVLKLVESFLFCALNKHEDALRKNWTERQQGIGRCGTKTRFVSLRNPLE